MPSRGLVGELHRPRPGISHGRVWLSYLAISLSMYSLIASLCIDPEVAAEVAVDGDLPSSYFRPGVYQIGDVQARS